MTIPLPPSTPSWLLINADNPISLPVMGQFDPKVQESRGKPRWATKPGVLGAPGWMRYTGEDLGYITFEFFAIANNVLDPYPLSAWLRLNELSKFNETTGSPPRVVFTHGLMIAEGYLTDVPEAPMEYWGGHNLLKSRIIRQIGPVRLTLTRLPNEVAEISLFTSYVPYTPDVTYEELAKEKYGDARYGQSLALWNNGLVEGDTIEVPRKRSSAITEVVPLAPALGTPIRGL